MEFESRFSEENPMKNSRGFLKNQKKKNAKIIAPTPTPETQALLAEIAKNRNSGKYSSSNLKYGKSPFVKETSEGSRIQKTSNSESFESSESREIELSRLEISGNFQNQNWESPESPESSGSPGAQKSENFGNLKALEPPKLENPASEGIEVSENWQNANDDVVDQKTSIWEDEDPNDEHSVTSIAEVPTRIFPNFKKAKKSVRLPNRKFVPAFIVHIERNPKKSHRSRTYFGLAWTPYGNAVFSRQPHVECNGKIVEASTWVLVCIEQIKDGRTHIVEKIYEVMENFEFSVENEEDLRNPKLIVNLTIGENTHSDMESYFVQHELCKWIRIKVEHAKGQGGRNLRIRIRRLQDPIRISNSGEKDEIVCFWEVERILSSTEGRRLQDLQDSESFFESQRFWDSQMPGGSSQNRIQDQNPVRIIDDPRNYGNPERVFDPVKVKNQNPEILNSGIPESPDSESPTSSESSETPKSLWNQRFFEKRSLEGSQFPGTGQTCRNASEDSGNLPSTSSSENPAEF